MKPKGFIKIFSLAIVLTLSLMLQPVLTVQADIDTEDKRPTRVSREHVDLSFPQELTITRPTNENGKAFKTGYANFFVVGTSDPSQTLYLDDEEIERNGEKGLFGVLVELEVGENIFDFQQGDNKETLVIERTVPKDTGVEKISTITERSIYPTDKRIVNPGEAYQVSVVAPSDGKVTAKLDGNEITLKQVAYADKGVPATFKGSFVTSTDKYDDDKVTPLGQIRYSLEYEGETTYYDSKGSVYVVGKNTDAKMEVSSYFGYVYPDTANLSEFKELLKQGATDYIETQNGGYFQLRSGGSIPTTMVSLVLNDKNIDNNISNIEYFSKTNGGFFKITGTSSPAYNVDLLENGLQFTMYNSTINEDFVFADLDKFALANIDRGEDSVTLTLEYSNPHEYWGYNVIFQDDITYLELEEKPKSGSKLRPLAGLNIMIDPGHGGSDIGALGVADLAGPTESEINLAHAYAIEEKLSALGANVVLSREEDDYFELDNRLRSFANDGCDMFISIHHNSVEHNIDANKTVGAEAYYHTDISKDATQRIMETITANTNRKYRDTYQSYYRVTISHYAPSMLLELGFMSNPVEYEKACDPQEIDKLAQATAAGVVAYFHY